MISARIASGFVVLLGLIAACSSGAGSGGGSAGSAGKGGLGAGGASGASGTAGSPLGGTGGGASGAAGSAGLGQGAWSGIPNDNRGSTVIACKPDDPCTICVAENCDAEASSCFGSGWKQQIYGATCEDFLRCECACDPNSSSCTQGCTSGAAFDACRGCVGVVTACIQDKCNPICCDAVPSSWCPDAGGV